MDKFYIGHTANLEDRLNRHNEGRSKYTKHGVPWVVVYSKTFETRSEAYQHETYIKKQKSKDFILRLINTNKQ